MPLIYFLFHPLTPTLSLETLSNSNKKTKQKPRDSQTFYPSFSQIIISSSLLIPLYNSLTHPARQSLSS